jgi:uncharacterized membrane protein
MGLLIAGLVLFIGGHLVSTIRGVRASLIGRLGEGGYKGAYSLAALAGLVLIVWGYGNYRAGGYIPVWDPPRAMNHVAALLMLPAFIALAASQSPAGKIRGWLKHPMLVGVKLWALAHLLANGDLGSIVLFGSLLAWAVYDRISVKRRGDAGAPPSASFTRGDAIAVGAGLVAYALFAAFHRTLIGVSIA